MRLTDKQCLTYAINHVCYAWSDEKNAPRVQSGACEWARPCVTHVIDATAAWRGSTASWNGTPYCWHFVTVKLCSWRRLPWRTPNCVQPIPDKTLGPCLTLDRCGSDNTRRCADAHLVGSHPQSETNSIKELRFQLVRSASRSV